MSDRVAFFEGRVNPRLALAGLALLSLAGCSSDITRFDASNNPLSNPFASKPADASSAGAAPAGKVTSAPLAPPTGVASASPPPTSSAAPVGGSATGWTAAGGSPIVVGQGESLDSISRKYGVPPAALLSANGMSSASEIKSGARIVVPVYNAGGRAVASASDKAKAASKSAKVAANEPESKANKAKAKDKDKEKAQKEPERTADKRKPQEKRRETASPSQASIVAKADPGKPAGKPAIDAAPTGALDPKAAQAKAPQTAEQADASGTTPEFRWPARGRIIEGFKAGGNDGINIAVPAGTSVRAAESGVVVYSGDGLKGYGNLVLIKHPNGFVSAYANNGELEVKRGESVKRGQIIAKSGDTGNVNAPQLHFELRKGSTPVDPTQYLAGL